jgi:hypothetical protein
MAALDAIEAATEVDLCPICGASGAALCVEEDGQTCLDRWGRPDTTAPDDDSAVAA